MSKRQFIDNLYKRRSDYKDPDQAEMAMNMLSKLSTDIYSENKRFVFEFIQNADDSARDGANQVLFDFLDDCLIVSHSGKVFDENDINSITNAGSSTKTADSTKTGYKGVGFKSVFGKSKRVSIFSDGFQFRFDKGFHANQNLPWQIIPIWTDPKDLSISAQKSLESLSYSVATIIELTQTKELEHELKELLADGEILLFLRHVTKITVKRNNVLKAEIVKIVTESSSAYKKIELRFDGKLVSTWLLKNFEKISISEETKAALDSDEDAPPKLKKSEFTDLAFAVKLKDNKITPLSRSESLIFTYLPTKVRDYEFPFLVNASFLTSTSRETLHENQIWNKWLFQMIARFIISWLEALASTQYRLQILHLLPGNSIDTNGLRQKFEQELRSIIAKSKFLIDTDGKIKPLEKLIWDQTGLSVQNFVERQKILDFIKATRKIDTRDYGFINPETEKLSTLYSYGLKTFELEDMDRFFESDFFQDNHKVSQNFDLIRYFKKCSDKDTDGLWFQKLKRMPFIFAEDGILANPSTGICFPTLPSSTELGDIPIIHKDVFLAIEKDKEVFDWLIELGVKEPSELAYVTNVIIPKLEEPDLMTELTHIQIISYLLRLFQNGQLTDEMLSQLRAIKLKTKRSDGHFIKAHDCYLSDRYQPNIKLESSIPGLNYLAEDYLKVESNEHKLHVFFKAISVKDRIEVETVDWLTIPEVRRITSEQWVDDAKAYVRLSGGFGFGDYNLIRNIKLPSFLNLLSKNYVFAETFWNNILSNANSYSVLSEKAVFVYGEGRGENRYGTRIDSYFKWFIDNNSCIPATTDTLVNSKDAFVSTKEVKHLAGKHLPVFTYDAPLSSDWKKLLGLKEGLELEHYLLILEKISTTVVDGEEIKKTEIKRIGSIYEKLSSLLPEYAEDKKEQIREWAKNNRIFSDQNSCEYPSDLMYINIPGFTGVESLKLIYLPDGLDLDRGNYRELLDLFAVKVVDKFKPIYQNVREDYDLKNRLLHILPYFAKLVESKEDVTFKVAYDTIHRKLSSLTFLNAQNINLAFTHHEQEILGPDLPIYYNDFEFCYTGELNDPFTKFAVIPQLYKLFGSAGLIEEFRLLLEIDEDAVQKWFKRKTIDVEELLKSPEYAQSQKLFKPAISLQPDKSRRVDPVNMNTGAPKTESSPFTTSEISVKKSNPSFVPKVKASEASFSKASYYEPAEKSPSIEYSMSVDDELDTQSKLDIGRWSEEYVFHFLKGKHKKITWVNEQKESYLPYDFIVVTNNDQVIYIEVKGTPSDNKLIFPISTGEWKLMFEQGENYFIYRVFSAGTDDPDLRMIANPAREISKGVILPNPIYIQI